MAKQYACLPQWRAEREVLEESFTHNLARQHPGSQAHDKIQRTATISTRHDGKKQATGDKTGVLKGTQTYTAAFGQEVATSFVDLRHFFDDLEFTGGQLDVEEDHDIDHWEDLDLEPLYQAVNAKHRVFE